VTDLLLPDLHLFILLRKTFFKALQESSYQFTSGGKNGEANHNEEYPLKDGEKEANNSQ